MPRARLAAAAAALLVVSLVRIPAPAGGQAAVSWSRPGQEDLSFWVNHNGLVEVDVEGEVGFGDMARLLMRRRSNQEKMRALRDRFVFRARDFEAIDTADVVRGEVSGGRMSWRGAGPPRVIAAGRIHNLPVIVVDRDRKTSAGYFVKVVEPRPGKLTRRFTVAPWKEEFTVGFEARAIGKLRVNLVDERGRPAAARVYLTGSDGLGYAPNGTISRFTAESAEQYFHARGSFEIELPAGETLIEATRGLEYRLARRSVTIEPGQSHQARIVLERWIDMAANGRYSSDAHIHANYTAEHHQVVTPEDAQLFTLAEDLHYANMMVANSSGAFIHDPQHFEGKPSAMSRGDHLIYWNEEMRNAGLYGHMCLYNLKTLVHPLYTGFRDTPHWEDYPANFTQAESAQKQGGAVTYAHPGYAANFDGFSARELPVDLALGQVDALDVLSNNPEEAAMEVWYRLLNCGLRLAISAGTDAFTNVADHYAPGGGRVYAHLDGPMDAVNWVRNYKRGRSFATNGAMIFFRVDGQEPGEETHPQGGRKSVKVSVTVRSQVPLDTVEVVANGRVVIRRMAAGKKSLIIEEDLPLERSAWIAARSLGPWHRLILNDARAFAHTSPVYAKLDGREISSAEDARYFVEWIGRLVERVDERGRFATPERRLEVVRLFERARDVFRKKAGGG